MDDLTQTISNLVGILLGVVGAVGVGYFVFGAYQYLTASGAPQDGDAHRARRDRARDGRVRRARTRDRRGRQPGGRDRHTA